MKLQKLDSSEFTFQLWGAGSYFELGLFNGHFDLSSVLGQKTIRKYAIGYCNAESIPVRPKIDCVAVMYLKDEMQFWSHLTNEEFENIFGINLND